MANSARRDAEIINGRNVARGGVIIVLHRLPEWVSVTGWSVASSCSRTVSTLPSAGLNTPAAPGVQDALDAHQRALCRGPTLRAAAAGNSVECTSCELALFDGAGCWLACHGSSGRKKENAHANGKSHKHFHRSISFRSPDKSSLFRNRINAEAPADPELPHGAPRLENRPGRSAAAPAPIALDDATGRSSRSAGRAGPRQSTRGVTAASQRRQKRSRRRQMVAWEGKKV